MTRRFPRAALPRARKAKAAEPRGPRPQQAAGLGSQGGFAAATHGRGHVRTTINIEIGTSTLSQVLSSNNKVYILKAQNKYSLVALEQLDMKHVFTEQCYA